MRAFVYETERVFADRLIADDDREWLRAQIDAQLQKHIGAKLRDVSGESGMDDVLFGDFLSPAGQKSGYAQIEDKDALQKTLQATLGQCNDELGGGMNLVLFRAAVTHLARIVRILRQDSSNLLLIGVGGVGRQSLTKLAAYHLNYAVRTVQLSKSYGVAQWREDVKDVLMDCGLSLKP